MAKAKVMERIIRCQKLGKLLFNFYLKKEIMKKVLLDSNFLISCLKFKVDLEKIEELLNEKVKFLIPKPALNEVKSLAGSKKRDSKFAKVALHFINSKKIEVLEVEGSADDAILKLAEKDLIVATNDLSLRKKLKVGGIKTIYLRGRKKLGVE